ncbi:hypothetical protein H2201_008067 [Coniosporium apollinis]|uniref:C2H2-type domain-containing protein n=1 Tax=Coniosporium apollinis TaxID=61459 RepID=A0ABQ9NNX6_9PEZI|nr:hypothetical protein H2201_008067 [Coniosporium apollinis]
MPIIDDKERGPNGDHRGRDGIAHHCHECRGAEKESCWYNGHLALCEVKDCRKRFNARWGCVRHRYREAYNLHAKAQFFGEDYEELEKKFAWMEVRSTETQEDGPPGSDTPVNGDEKVSEKNGEYRLDFAQTPEVEPKTESNISVKTSELTPQQSTKLGRKYKEPSPSPEPEDAPREEPKTNAKTRKREKFAALMEKKMGKHASGSKKPGRVSDQNR